MSAPKEDLAMACCPIDSHGPLRQMQHALIPTWSFWMCSECELVWLEVEGGKPKGEQLSLWKLFGDHGWPLIEEGRIIVAR